MQLAKIADKEIAVPSAIRDLVTKSGSLKSINAVAKERGIVKAKGVRGGGDQWKALSTEIMTAKREFDSFVRQVTSASSIDKSMKGTKAKVIFDKNGVFRGTDSSFRKITVKDMKDMEQGELAAQAARVKALEDICRAAGIQLPA
jgi:hypothetical protein